MRAVLLAGGIGSRIKEINVPKCTLKVNHASIISQTIEMLQNNGVSVAVVTGYKDSYVVAETQRFSNVSIFHNPFFRVTNSIASLWFASSFAFGHGEDLILANADVMWDQHIFDLLVSSKDERVMICDSSHVKEGLGDFFFRLDGNTVVDYGKELPLKERDTEYVGIAKISDSTLQAFKTKMDELILTEKYNMWWENILYEDLNRNPIITLDLQGYPWGEVDSIEDYQRLVAIMEQRKQ